MVGERGVKSIYQSPIREDLQNPFISIAGSPLPHFAISDLYDTLICWW
jgi:hypothetical protein